MCLWDFGRLPSAVYVVKNVVRAQPEDKNIQPGPWKCAFFGIRSYHITGMVSYEKKGLQEGRPGWRLSGFGCSRILGLLLNTVFFFSQDCRLLCHWGAGSSSRSSPPTCPHKIPGNALKSAVSEGTTPTLQSTSPSMGARTEPATVWITTPQAEEALTAIRSVAIRPPNSITSVTCVDLAVDSITPVSMQYEQVS